jgi:hypothetical protein
MAARGERGLRQLAHQADIAATINDFHAAADNGPRQAARSAGINSVLSAIGTAENTNAVHFFIR